MRYDCYCYNYLKFSMQESEEQGEPEESEVITIPDTPSPEELGSERNES